MRKKKVKKTKLELLGESVQPLLGPEWTQCSNEVEVTFRFSKEPVTMVVWTKTGTVYMGLATLCGEPFRGYGNDFVDENVHRLVARLRSSLRKYVEESLSDSMPHKPEATYTDMSAADFTSKVLVKYEQGRSLGAGVYVPPGYKRFYEVRATGTDLFVYRCKDGEVTVVRDGNGDVYLGEVLLDIDQQE